MESTSFKGIFHIKGGFRNRKTAISTASKYLNIFENVYSQSFYCCFPITSYYVDLEPAIEKIGGTID